MQAAVATGTWEPYHKAVKRQDREVREAQQQSWRRALAKASNNMKDLWGLEKWAKLYSTSPHASAGVPPLGRAEGDTPLAFDHESKAKLLAERFFPTPPADLRDIPEEWQIDSDPERERCSIAMTVDADDVAEIVRSTAPWKAPGPDQVPTGLLKACGPPLWAALAKIANARLALGYFPKRFRSAIVAVIPKANKTPAEKAVPGGWRPIALLSSVGKVIETVIAKRLAAAAEEHLLLPDEQMGNRKERSTELAIRMVVDTARAAWTRGGTATLLQLDFSGAFDTVNHRRLLYSLWKKGISNQLLAWLRSYLAARTVRMRFDEETSAEFRIQAGVPQGSPLSPILFILYLTSLYEEVAEAHPLLVSVGFAEDTNLLEYHKDPAVSCSRLEEAWMTCSNWAKRHGMKFNPKKSILMHLSPRRAAHQHRVRLGNAAITPQDDARFLGVFLDRRLT